MTKLAYLSEKYFNNRCSITLEKFKPKGFVIHHINYIKNDVRRKDFPKGVKGTEAYYTALESQIIKRPDDFTLVKNGIHTKMDHYRNGVARLNLDNLIRFCSLALLTKIKQ